MSSATCKKREAVIKAEADCEEVKVENSVFIIDSDIEQKP